MGVETDDSKPGRTILDFNGPQMTVDVTLGEFWARVHRDKDAHFRDSS